MVPVCHTGGSAAGAAPLPEGFQEPPLPPPLAAPGAPAIPQNMQTLIDYSAGVQAAGPISQTAARMQEAAAGSGTPATTTFLGRTDPPVAFGVAPAAVLPFSHTPEAVPPHVWAPMQELSRGSAQAKFVLDLLQQHESQRTLNPS